MPVRETTWAEGDRKAYRQFADDLPALLETVFTDWQARVDQKNKVQVDNSGALWVVHVEMCDKGKPPVTHADLWSLIKASYLVQVDPGTSNPERAFAVVKQHVAAHYPDKSVYSYGTSGYTIHCLDGTTKDK